ncbi:hypothetical protein ACFWVM_29180 [Nocardia fluminea]|uniref:hypothetical protein n=1 Tax=Nocardia fluminea TaxID=134984 RepID=UPI003649FED3
MNDMVNVTYTGTHGLPDPDPLDIGQALRDLVEDLENTYPQGISDASRARAWLTATGWIVVTPMADGLAFYEFPPVPQLHSASVRFDDMPMLMSPEGLIDLLIFTAFTQPFVSLAVTRDSSVIRLDLRPQKPSGKVLRFEFEA